MTINRCCYGYCCIGCYSICNHMVWWKRHYINMHTIMGITKLTRKQLDALEKIEIFLYTNTYCTLPLP